jgi:energy-coupling factor transporter ATP-binding protein EcfA2
MKFYTATLSRTQGRGGYSVIFRHPVRLDQGTGKPGRRVRRGLGTGDEAEASVLVAQLNEILQTPELWEPSARSRAGEQADARVVDIFYDGVESAQTDFSALREAMIPLPSQDEGYRKVLLLGTTGAGKTTVVRQLLGTDPETERFPSTSTAKTTVADTEIITTADNEYMAAVTFTPRDEVVDYLTENVSDAALAAFKGKDDQEITRRLLDHVNQRFRFSYILGRTSVLDADDDVIDDDDTDLPDIDPEDYGHVDLGTTNQVVINAVRSVRTVVERHAQATLEEFQPSKDDERVVAEYVEENLDAELRQTDEFHDIVDSLIDEIEKRFATLDVGHLKKSRQGWPVSWSWMTDDREAFIKVVTRFSSNYAPLFGRLLTPLVNGIRVKGPFRPEWAADPAKLVLIDGEGLGHTPKSVATLSTHVALQLEDVDAILLVDNATQPMQAAPVAALKSIALSGNATKLHYLFTHFDQVKGDNLPTFSAREEHVLASVENVLGSIGDDLGPAAERVLRARLDRARFFVGGIHEQLSPKKKVGARSIQQFEGLIHVLSNPEAAVDAGLSRPVFDRMNLSLAVTEAAKNFHTRWRGLLGLDVNPDAPKEHWTRVKALSRRLADGRTDEYESLKPVADLRNALQRQVYLMLQQPVRWEGGDPSDDERQAIIDEVQNAVTKKLMHLTRQRLKQDVRLGWQEAYVQRGPGSTFDRARIIANEVYDKGAPIPTVSASPDRNSLMNDVASLVSEVAEEFDVVLM